MKNPRKGKILFSLWLTEDEAEWLIRELESFPRNSLLVKKIMRRAFDRGDLERR